MRSIIKHTIILGLGFSIVLPLCYAKEYQPVQDIPVLQPNKVETIKLPAPHYDTNRVWPGATANLTREVATGRYFKGLTDDTLRIVTVQSGGTRFLVIATDTMSTSFIKNGFRIETPYSFTSGSTAYAVAVGDVDGDEYTDILAGHSATPFRLIWFEWEPSLPNWVPRDSFAVNAAINDITFGNGDNNPLTRDFYINIAQTAPSAAFMRVIWTGTAWDTTRILLSGTIACRGIAIGDIRPELIGNEIYPVGGSRIWQVHFTGMAWDTTTITSVVAGAWDVVVGEVNPLNPGLELCVVHGSTSYQISIWNWTGALWSGIAWQWTTTWGTADNDIALGDVLKENPGNELILTGGASTAAIPVVFWYAPNGSAWITSIPKVVSAQAEYGIVIGDINRFRTHNLEFVLTGGGSLVEGEQRDFVNDIGTYWVRIKNSTSIRNLSDTVIVTIFNSGSALQTNFLVGYRFKHSPLIGSITYTGVLPSGAIDSVRIPLTMDFLGMDTLYAFTNLSGDPWVFNDTTKLRIEVYDESTKVASGFNAVQFPPAIASFSPIVNTPYTWWRTIISGTHNWARYTSGTNPTCSPLEGGAMAGYPSFSASSGSQARLRTHLFNTGPEPRKVMLRFYMYGDPGFSTAPDSIIIEHSSNDTVYTRVASFPRYNPVAGWYRRDVELGDFAANKNLYIGFRANSGYGNNMFIDSVRVFVTTPTALSRDAGVQNILPFPKPVLAGTPCTVKVVIKNYGFQTLTNIPVFYTLGEADTVWGIWIGSLDINETAQYNFPIPFIPSNIGDDTVYAGTRLSGDQNPANDVANLIFTVCPASYTPPYIKDFNEAWLNSTEPPFCGWRIIDGGTQSPPVVDGNDWHRFVSTSPARTVARINFSPIEWSDDWLISPRFNCSAPGIYTLNYWHFYNDFATARLDSGRVLVSTDDGITWETIHRYSNADDSGYKSVDVSSFVSGNSNVRFAFHYVANDEFYWYIDDFVLNLDPIGIAEGNKKKVEYFLSTNPNPFTREIIIKYGIPQPEEVEVIVYNAIGQNVKRLVKKTLDSGIYTIKWNGVDEYGRRLPNGVYFVQMRMGDKKMTEKVLMVK